MESGELDANYFQHITYMNQFNESDGTHLVSAAEIHYEPLGLYAGKDRFQLRSWADGAQIAVTQRHHQRGPGSPAPPAGRPHHPEGGRRHHRHQGPTIAENPKNLEIVELEASQIPSRLEDVELAVINGNYAIDAGLKVADALAVESADGRGRPGLRQRAGRQGGP